MLILPVQTKDLNCSLNGMCNRGSCIGDNKLCRPDGSNRIILVTFPQFCAITPNRRRHGTWGNNPMATRCTICMSSEWKIKAKTDRNNTVWVRTSRLLYLVLYLVSFHTFYSPPFWSSRGNQGDFLGTSCWI
jgi:hypothetical protein